jgi:hypothetical protein
MAMFFSVLLQRGQRVGFPQGMAISKGKTQK